MPYHLGTEQEKVDFLVRKLSVAASVDFSSYFVRWGFPVSKAVMHELRTLRPAELDEAARTIAMQYKIPIKISSFNKIKGFRQ